MRQRHLSVSSDPSVTLSPKFEPFRARGRCLAPHSIDGRLNGIPQVLVAIQSGASFTHPEGWPSPNRPFVLGD